MGNNIRGYEGIKLQLDRERTFRLDFNAYEKLEELYGSFDSAMESLTRGNVSDLKKFLFSGLAWEDEELTLIRVGQLFNSIEDIIVLREVVFKHLHETLVTDDAETEKK